MKPEIIKIGTSDYTRKEMESGNCNGAIGGSAKDFLDTIAQYEQDGYVVSFETSFWRKIFCMGIYKVIATK